MPITAAWSTPGVVLLISSIGFYPYSSVIGAFIIAAIATILLGLTGWYSRVDLAGPERGHHGHAGRRAAAFWHRPVQRPAG